MAILSAQAIYPYLFCIVLWHPFKDFGFHFKQKQIMENKKPEIIVILGNGFDMDYGLETSYGHFCNSSFWPSDSNPSDLEKFISERTRNNWYDLESLLAIYAHDEIKYISETNGYDKAEYLFNVNHDLGYFLKLKESLKSFIKNQQNRIENPKQNSTAINVFKAIFQFRNPIIYSFNYTSLGILLYKAKFPFSVDGFSYTHVHGSIAEDDIIFGIEDNVEIPIEYDFLKKVSDPNYRSNNLYYDLIKAKEVIIFGHSLGSNDYHFFRRFFQIHSNEANSDYSQKCKITFFTANSKSRMDILANLREMNGRKNNQLFAQNDLRFIRTCENDKSSIMDYYKWEEDLEETSK